MREPHYEPEEFWKAPRAEVLNRLRASGEGLSSNDATARLAAYGPNRFEDQPSRRLVLDFLSRFHNPLVLILLAAAIVSALTHEPASFAIITTVVLLSVTLDFVQEHRAATAARRLQERVALRVTAIRDGRTLELPATGIVPGDLVLLAAGDLVPADCRLLEAKDLFVNEASLTGEPYPSEKQANDLPPREDGDSAVRSNGVFMGSSVVSGTAKALVVTTGRSTRLGAIAGELRRPPPPTAFTLGIQRFGMLIVRLTVLLVLFVILVNLVFERPLLESFLFALALAVGLTPELLPMIVSVALAHGAIRMARKDVIVKRLSAIHDLGSMDVLCSDKTGTLTEASIKLIREVDLTGADSGNVLRLAYVNAAFETGLKSPLDEAILKAEPIDLKGWRKIDEVPFDFERRRVSVLVEHDGKRLLVVKGAPEDVLKLSSRYQKDSDAHPVPLDQGALDTARHVFEALGEEGFRALGVAWREVEPDRDHAYIDDEIELIFAGFAAFLDPPKESARPALDALARLDVAVKIITGDNERVTRHVCRELGIAITGVLTGPELAEITDEALAARLDQVNLFCRVTPPQKARILRALKRRGHVVGYLGDGINDAPSLHAADVGLSVEGAVDVAKEAATMIMLRNDLGVLAEGVREGRRTFANIMKYVMMGTSSNFGNMFSMAGAVLFLPFLPLLPVQILLNNLLYDVSEIAIPLDRVDEEMVARPQHWDMRFVRDFMLVLGPVSSLFDFLTFGLLLWVFQTGEELFRTGWFMESLATQVLVIFIIRSRGSPLRSLPHPLLTATSLAAVTVAVVLPFTPVGVWFDFVAPPAGLMLALAAMTVLYLLVAEQAKQWFYARHPLTPVG
ncbi:MAG: magnesium-translocating P-type ATPase [Planctomycetes bacterium]|nr:magnesium-translocating P-type ATPase [Planctomycetota bacterium]